MIDTNSIVLLQVGQRGKNVGTQAVDTPMAGMSHLPSFRLLLHQCVGPTIPDSLDAVTGDDADQASVAVPSMIAGDVD